MKSTIISLLTLLLVALMAVGCKKDKQKTTTPVNVDTATDTTADDEEEVEEEAQEEEEEEEVKGPKPGDYPEAPENAFEDRKPAEYLVSIKKAQIMPASPDGTCWDECNANSQTAVTTGGGKITAVGATSQANFEKAAKALEGVIGLAGGQTSLPDVFVHIVCGNGNAHKTAVVADKMIPAWKYENKKMKLDPRDECAISVWDKDEEERTEIGRTVVSLVEAAKGGTAILYGADVGFGLVYSLEISVQLASAVEEANKEAEEKEGVTPGDPSASYKIDIISVKIKDKKKDGTEWDAAIPGASMLGGMAGGTAPDLFVEGWKNGYKSTAAFMKTATKKETASADFNETGRVKLKDSDHIQFMVWDADASNHDIVGECKTKKISEQGTGEITLKCGLVEELVVKIEKL